MFSRRDVIKALGLSAAANSMPSLALASAVTEARFVLVVLRGAVDGLALAAPYGDGNYERVRGELALPKPGQQQGILKLDGLFGLHPSLAGLYSRYQDNEAIVIHAAASPYRERSHFDGQDILENGAARVGALRDGWLNRALGPINRDTELAIALAQNTPLVLRGDNSVTSWAPSKLPGVDDSTIARLKRLYADDEFFANRLDQALRSQDIAGGMAGMTDAKARGNEAQQFANLMQSAARFLTAPHGPRIAVVESGGWDTHANQGASSGALANRFAALDTGLLNLQTGLGRTWRKTVIAIVTEFGRTVHVNGTRGTDHGTAAAAVLVGGAVNGGRIIADWPGLREKDLYAGRDLRPTTDIRSLFKGILEEHLKLSAVVIEEEIFPDSHTAIPLHDLIRI